MDRPNRSLLTKHASVVFRERDIPVEWVRRVLAHPRLRLPDEDDPDLLHALAPVPVIGSQEVSAGIVHDFNDRSQVVGIEVLDLKKRFPNADPKTIRLEMA